MASSDVHLKIKVTGDKIVTEREAAQRERRAFDRGALAEYDHYFPGQGGPQLDVLGRTQNERAVRRAKSAAARFPIPKVTRPRVWRDPQTGGGLYAAREFRFANGQLQTRTPAKHEEWLCLSDGSAHTTDHPAGFSVTPERIAAWADLMANPTEEVEDVA